MFGGFDNLVSGYMAFTEDKDPLHEKDDGDERQQRVKGIEEYSGA